MSLCLCGRVSKFVGVYGWVDIRWADIRWASIVERTALILVPTGLQHRHTTPITHLFVSRLRPERDL